MLGKVFLVSILSSVVLAGCSGLSQYKFYTYTEAEQYLEKEYLNQRVRSAMTKTFSLNTEKDRLTLYTLTEKNGNNEFAVKMRIYGFDSYDLDWAKKYKYQVFQDMQNFIVSNQDVLAGQFYTLYYGKAVFNCSERKLKFVEGFIYGENEILQHPNTGKYFTDTPYKVKQIYKSGAPGDFYYPTSSYHRPPADYLLFKAFKDKVPEFISKYCVGN
ncbi:hypothetical protein QV06_01030 [Gallibacterium genomosp. 3]|uniref:Lipoprotein n=1 Tax=Gallibacterium genomosp. 3 TaxID=505345 RepID=A0A1A7PVJ9_9PAST|nr:hypothetical protein [Gallibacterium genomosp. 3]OBX05747.1 hypothetical protein QV06_01030 [Gallibacterium genomosp. 3]